MRQVMVRRMGPERRLKMPAARRNRRFTPAVESGSGEKFAQPGGTIWRGKKGEKERRSWRLYGGVLKGWGCVTGK
jgi:hypothetical protein